MIFQTLTVSRIPFLIAVLAILSGLLAGCDRIGYAPLPTASLPPTQEVIVAVITPSLRPLQPALWACAKDLDSTALFLEEQPAQAFEEISADLYIRLGQTDRLTPFTAQIGSEQISIILHPEHRISRLPTGELRELFSGHRSRWEDLDAPVVVWTFPEGEEIRRVFEGEILGSESLTTQALLAPDAQAMLEGVASQRGAIGYIPSAWLDGSMKVIEVEDSLRTRLNLPILAYSPGEPEGNLLRLLACLQSGEGQQMISDIYQAGSDRD